MNIPSMQELLSAGVHFGHQVRRGNPKMAPYIFGVREGVHIIDLEKSEQKLKEASQAAFELGKESKIMLVVGTKKQAKQIVEELSKEVGAPFLVEKWVGGLLTNFEEIGKNIKKLLELKNQQAKGELSHYTKRERLLISRKINNFERELGGVADLTKVPDAIFVVDAHGSKTAVREANRVGIVLLGICDTNSDPSLFDYPIPANDDGIKSIKLICETIIKAYGEGKKEAGKIKSDKEKDEGSAAEETTATLDQPVVEEAAAIEEEVEKKVLEESERKVE